MDSLNPYEPSNVSTFEEGIGRSTWPRAVYIAAGYGIAAIFLFGSLQFCLSKQRNLPSPPLMHANIANYVYENFSVALWFAGPMAIAAALLDFLPRKRLGVIRSFAIAGGILLSIHIATGLAMDVFDDHYRDTFVRSRRTYGERPTFAFWIARGLVQLVWLASMWAILWRRLRQTAS